MIHRTFPPMTPPQTATPKEREAYRLAHLVADMHQSFGVNGPELGQMVSYFRYVTDLMPDRQADIEPAPRLAVWGMSVALILLAALGFWSMFAK